METILEISFGRNRSDTNWKADYLEWEEFVDRLRKVRRTHETMAEYDKMSKDKRGKVKDGPAFVGGLIRGGRRKKANVESRWLVTLDADHADGDFMLNVDLILAGTAYAIYSTHSHRPKKPKYRLVVPSEREMTPDEYAAVSRKLAEQIGMEYFDKTTFDVHRLMYLPSCSKDAEPVLEVGEGDLLNVDAVLDEYENWQDPLEWPVHPGEEKERRSQHAKMEDPYQKRGVVGAFCRSYTISAAIEEFLKDVYEPTVHEDRYTYTGSTSYGGLVVYDNDTFAYSYHESDPLSGREVNVFDLVRIHKFGDLDDGASKKTNITKLPSYQAMTEFAATLPDVKKLMHEERMEELKEDFADGLDGSETGDWTEKLELHPKSGKPYANSRNLEILLSHGPLEGVLAYDAFKNREVILKDLPWRKRRHPHDAYEPWLGADDGELRHYLGKLYDIKSANLIRDAFTHVTRKNTFHPIHDYIESFEWDGVKRLETLFVEYLGAEDTPYVRTVTRKMFVAAVTRIYEPGTKFDEMLVLVGPQGCGKSTILAKMGRQWFCDSLKTFDSKEAGEYLQSSWIFEFGELSAMKKAEVEEIKAFTSKTTDMYRVAYDRVVSEFPRKCVFFGTTNNYDFLKDQTGNRRFWPVNVDPKKAVKNVFTDLTDEVVGQLWAEAKHYYDQGEKLTLPQDIAETARVIQEAHTEDDPRKGMIMEFLEAPVQDDFMDEPTKRTQVCAAEIWVECFGREKGHMRPWDAKEIYSILRTIPGWEDAGRKRVKHHGIQRVFERVC